MPKIYQQQLLMGSDSGIIRAAATFQPTNRNAAVGLKALGYQYEGHLHGLGSCSFMNPIVSSSTDD
jgi:hypothetical protein